MNFEDVVQNPGLKIKEHKPEKICAMSMASESYSYVPCFENKCAWWNEDFGMCAIAAIAQMFTRPIVKEEQ